MKAAEDAANSPRAAKDTVKGMRTVQVYEIESHKSALNWIALNDRDALTVIHWRNTSAEFKLRPIDGVKVEHERKYSDGQCQ